MSAESWAQEIFDRAAVEGGNARLARELRSTGLRLDEVQVCSDELPVGEVLGRLGGKTKAVAVVSGENYIELVQIKRLS